MIENSKAVKNNKLKVIKKLSRDEIRHRGMMAIFFRVLTTSFNASIIIRPIAHLKILISPDFITVFTLKGSQTMSKV